MGQGSKSRSSSAVILAPTVVLEEHQLKRSSEILPNMLHREANMIKSKMFELLLAKYDENRDSTKSR